MTKKEMIERLESISSQIDQLEKLVEQKSLQNRRAIYKSMDLREQQLEHTIRKLEISFEEKLIRQTETLSEAI
ncbi:hypothetical protein ACFFF5_02010 [Lederbergia wuyishanensis]|uniref:Protein subunit release factor A n=1 Tax=Lederbergia wuyishanensis TaxID=1347903 RepID=A0ABU0D0V9_9BACI|nr:hypothetical protein [Lederbergia wuyishanensis]MCJ8006643.1 hypothetical protein [Lederbergia wuyishanensis]MDQ0342024.1 protein subunit release factor A [Lederbergia wuyishanensis]